MRVNFPKWFNKTIKRVSKILGRKNRKKRPEEIVGAAHPPQMKIIRSALYFDVTNYDQMKLDYILMINDEYIKL